MSTEYFPRELIELIATPGVAEVSMNGDRWIWLEANGRGMERTNIRLVEAGIQRIFEIARECARCGDAPIVESVLPPWGCRFTGVSAPIVAQPIFTLRLPLAMVRSLDDYRRDGIIRPIDQLVEQRKVVTGTVSFDHPVNAIQQAVASRKNILVVGGGGSGKTTLSNAILHQMVSSCPGERIILLQDIPELSIPGEANGVALCTAGAWQMSELLRVTMRLRVDRIIVGEVRGAEAYALLKSWNSGHPGGVATIHANSAQDGMQKLMSYCYESPDVMNIPASTLGWLLVSAIDLVLFIERTNGGPSGSGRMVTQICEVIGWMDGRFNMRSLRMQSATGRSEYIACL